MAVSRIARKDFVKCLGAAAAACLARPAMAATARMAPAQKAKPVAAADLPYKVRPAARIVALRDTVA